MRRVRAYVPVPLAPHADIPLPPEVAHHLGKVLRLGAGDPVVLFDGTGLDYPATLTGVHRQGATARTGAAEPVANESSLAVTLALGVARGERMDYAIQKAVELGVAVVAPVLTARTAVRLDAARAASRHRHWSRVLTAACEQCGRARLPRLEPVRSLAEWLAEPTAGPGLLLSPHDATPLAGLGPPPEGRVTVLIGPEGGLSEGERATARDHGYRPVRLGPRVLRAETAAVAALAALQLLWGDLGAPV